ncbi:unnamed protein product [Cercospora beticola]|nr:unnamed protein product [Cercospora beticola]
MQTVNLIESFITAGEYNQLSHIDDMRDAPGNNPGALRALLGLVRRNGHGATSSAHLLHKHLDAPEGSIMVHETKAAPKHPTFMVFGLREPAKVPNVRGLYYQAQPGGKMLAYEYTSDEGFDVDQYGDFVEKFPNLCYQYQVQTRCGKHYEKKKKGTFYEPLYEFDGQYVLPDSDIFKVFHIAEQAPAIAVC